MPDKVRVNEDEGIIEIESYGVVSKADIADSFEKLKVILEKKHMNKLFVDTTKQETMPTSGEIYELFSEFPHQFRLALLISETQTTAGDVSLVETVTVNRAIQARLFYDKAEALEWLKS